MNGALHNQVLSYPGEFVVVTRSRDILRYARFDRRHGLTMIHVGEIESGASHSEATSNIAGHLTLYLLSQGEYSTKQLEFASRFRLDTDPDQICWEIERRSVMPFHQSRYNFLSLQAQGRDSLLAFALSDSKQHEIGECCRRAQSVLHRLIFKPVALNNRLGPDVAGEQSVVVVASPNQVTLLFYHHRHLTELRTLNYNLSDPDRRSGFIDDLGTLAASVFSGVRLNQRLEIVVAGLDGEDPLFDRLPEQLPYRLTLKHMPLASICHAKGSSAPLAESYFDLAIVAKAFVESEPCESLPVKNVVIR